MVFIKKAWIIIIGLGLLPIASFASDNSVLDSQRQTFQQAKQALDKSEITRFHALKQQLTDYPLEPYLDYLYLRARLHRLDDKTVSTFLYNNQNSFYAIKLRDGWLNQLAKQKKWSLFLKHYKLPQPASRQCLRLQALIATGQYQQAMADIPTLWMVNKSQHKNCDPAFSYWQEQGFPDDDMRWQRIQLALENNQLSLAKYLAKFINTDFHATEWVSHWQKMHQNPSKALQAIATQKIAFKKYPPVLIESFIKQAITRLARRSTDQAFLVWKNIQTSRTFSPEYRHTVQAIIANRAALNRQDRTLEYFGNLANEPWRVRAALWQQNWPEVEKAIQSLDPEEQQSSRWQYWLGRAQAKMGQQQTANDTFQSIITERDYYSFLAADILQQDYQMNHEPLSADLTEISRFSRQAAVARLREFYALNMSLESRQQAYRLKQTLKERDLQLLAILTHQWGWHNQTIALLGKAQYWDDLALRFPVVFGDLIVKESKHHRLDPSWLLGIARQESAFNPRARSPVGALGLMQLMPATGKATAKSINRPIKNLNELLNPSRNIQLGSTYLKQMYDKNQQNPVLATASYNAGPHRIARWLPKTDLSADIWIENIPFNETRKYTSNVLSYAAIFDHQRKQLIKPITERMPAIKAKKP